MIYHTVYIIINYIKFIEKICAMLFCDPTHFDSLLFLYSYECNRRKALMNADVDEDARSQCARIHVGRKWILYERSLTL